MTVIASLTVLFLPMPIPVFGTKAWQKNQNRLSAEKKVQDEMRRTVQIQGDDAACRKER